MVTNTRNWIMAGMLGLLVACGGGGGGNSASGVEAGPPPPGQPVPPPPPIQPTPVAPYADAEELIAYISSVTLNADNQAVVDFQLTNENGTAITDLEVGNVRFLIAKLQPGPQGNLTGDWQSYVNSISEPEVGPGTEPALEATYERSGEFTNHEDGTYTYQFETSLTDLPSDILAQAATQGLDLSYDPNLTHRVVIQFDGSMGWANPNYDWVPATGATTGIFTRDIAATTNCNRCHDPLALHGGNRREIKYCDVCHNPGSSDPNSGNTVDLKVMAHKIHMGANLPSVQAGEPYYIIGFRNSVNDYSDVKFPQDIRNCVNCHAGSATGEDPHYPYPVAKPGANAYSLTLTSQGDNWSQYPSQAACGSCHDDLDFATHAGGQTDDSNCASCHSLGGIAGSIQNSHRILAAEATQNFLPEILAVDNSMQGEEPVITFKITNPETGEDYALLTDPVFTGASVSVRMAWNTTDYTNTGNDMEDASSVSVAALSEAMPNGDGSYNVTMPLAIPDGSERPFIPATGSGAAVVEGRLSIALEDGASPSQVPLTNVHSFFSIDEASGQAVPRRTSVELNNCLSCHQSLAIHGNNRSNDINSCVTCHNPRNTDREVREIAATPPTDGKDEESLDFKRMVHGIHAAGIRVNALQIVGFQGRTTYVYDEEEVQYPGNLADCVTCHTASGYTLPLPSGVLGTTIDTGADLESPVDDTVITPATAVCSSCHDGQEPAAHMVANGGSFSTSQEAIDSGAVVEQCSVCHGSGKVADVSVVHGIAD